MGDRPYEMKDSPKKYLCEGKIFQGNRKENIIIADTEHEILRSIAELKKYCKGCEKLIDCDTETRKKIKDVFQEKSENKEK